MGIEITEVHSIWPFTQKRFMKDYIEAMAHQRATTEDVVAKDITKMAMTSLSGKMLQDKSGQRNLTPYTDAASFVNACSREGFANAHLMQLDSEEGQAFLGLVESFKKLGIMLNTPRAIGFSILELSK